MQLYPELLELQSRFPDLSFAVEAAPNSRIIDLVQENQVELGISWSLQRQEQGEQSGSVASSLCGREITSLD